MVSNGELCLSRRNSPPTFVFESPTFGVDFPARSCPNSIRTEGSETLAIDSFASFPWYDVGAVRTNASSYVFDHSAKLLEDEPEDFITRDLEEFETMRQKSQAVEEGTAFLSAKKPPISSNFRYPCRDDEAVRRNFQRH